MVAKGSAHEGFFALYDGTGNSNAVTLQRVTTKCVLDYELVELCQRHGAGVFRAEPIGNPTDATWPFVMLCRALLDHAE